MRQFFSTILSLFFFFILGFTLCFNVLRMNLNTSAIIDFGTKLLMPDVNFVQNKNPNDSGLFYPEDKIITLTEYDFSEMNLGNIDIAQIVQSYLDDYDIDIQVDNELIKEVLSTPEATNLLENYMDEFIDYVSGNSDSLNIDSDELQQVIEVAIDIYEKSSGEKVQYDSSELKEAIEEGIKEGVPAIEETLDEVKEKNSEIIAWAKVILKLFSVKNLILLIIILVILAAGIWGINLKFNVMLRYISIPAIINGVFIFILGICGGLVIAVILACLPQQMLSGSETISKFLRHIFNGFSITGIITLITGIILCVLGFIPHKEKI